jgi:hypothetical protein
MTSNCKTYAMSNQSYRKMTQLSFFYFSSCPCTIAYSVHLFQAFSRPLWLIASGRDGHNCVLPFVSCLQLIHDVLYIAKKMDLRAVAILEVPVRLGLEKRLPFV